nr:unnamed protein product [Callosobruchus analis]
MAPTLERLL